MKSSLDQTRHRRVLLTNHKLQMTNYKLQITQVSTRTCEGPQYGGEDCQGPHEKEQNC